MQYSGSIAAAVALTALTLASAGVRAANLDEVTVSGHSSTVEQTGFPWSRYVDFDPSTSVTTIKIGKDCHLSFVLTAFSAACTSEAPRADLFDPRYRVSALELPRPALSNPDSTLVH